MHRRTAYWEWRHFSKNYQLKAFTAKLGILKWRFDCRSAKWFLNSLGWKMLVKIPPLQTNTQTKQENDWGRRLWRWGVIWQRWRLARLRRRTGGWWRWRRLRGGREEGVWFCELVRKWQRWRRSKWFLNCFVVRTLEKARFKEETSNKKFINDSCWKTWKGNPHFYN